MLRPFVLLIAAIVAMVACQAWGPWPSPADPSQAARPDPSGMPRVAEPADSILAAPHPDCDQPPADDGLYLLSPSRGGAVLRPLAPDSLADQPGCAWLPNQPAGQPFGLSRRSNDGTLIASIESDQRAEAPFFFATVVVRDAATGEDRGRFSPPGPIGSLLHFSTGDSLLLVQGWYAAWRSDSVAWYVVDAESSELLATLPAEPGAYGHPFFVSDGPYLYRLIMRSSMDPGGSYPSPVATEQGPWPIEIVVNDLSADGSQVARLALPTVRGGSWWSERSVNGNRIPAQIMPGAALSPDRGKLALAHADEDAVTIVDLDRLAVVRTFGLNRTLSWGESLLERLALWPATALAKGMDGHTRRARFAPDGRTLWVWGGETRMEENGGMIERAVPLRLVDPEGGRFLAELSVESPSVDMLASADGRHLYLGTHRRPDPGGTPGLGKPVYVLRRVDPTSLAVLAQREIRNFQGLLYGPWRPGFDRGDLPTTS